MAPLRATCFWLLVPIISLLRICCAFRAHADQSILAVPFGHCQYNAPLSRLETYFFHKMEDFSTLGRRSDCRLHLVFSVWAFCGVKPHKKGPQFFWKFRIKILCLKSRKLYFSILGPKTVQIDVFWSQKYGILVFLTKNQFYNFLIFGLRKISKIFEKFVKFFSIFFSNFSIFYTFFANFYNLHQLLTHLELY